LDFAFEMNEVAYSKRPGQYSDAVLRIPRDAMISVRIEQGDIHFFELAALSVETRSRSGI